MAKESTKKQADDSEDKPRRSKKLFFFVGIILIAAIGTGAFFFFRSRGGDGDPLLVAAEEKINYGPAFSFGETSFVYVDKEPQYEITLQRAYELNAKEKTAFGLDREPGRLVAIELEIGLENPDLFWRAYNRRVREGKDLWLDEVYNEIDGAALAKGEKVSETIVVSMAAESTAEELTFFVYTDSWNRQKKGDGECLLTIEPPAAITPAARDRNVETEYGKWVNGVYTSQDLNLKMALPEGWTLESAFLTASDAITAVEGSARRSNNTGVFQLSVERAAGASTEQSNVDYFRNLLKDSPVNYTISEPFRQTIAGKSFLGISYTHSATTTMHWLFFYKTGNQIIGISLQLPESDETGFNQVLNSLQTIE